MNTPLIVLVVLLFLGISILLIGSMVNHHARTLHGEKYAVHAFICLLIVGIVVIAYNHTNTPRQIANVFGAGRAYAATERPLAYHPRRALIHVSRYVHKGDRIGSIIAKTSLGSGWESR